GVDCGRSRRCPLLFAPTALVWVERGLLHYAGPPVVHKPPLHRHKVGGGEKPRTCSVVQKPPLHRHKVGGGEKPRTCSVVQKPPLHRHKVGGGEKPRTCSVVQKPPLHRHNVVAGETPRTCSVVQKPPLHRHKVGGGGEFTPNGGRTRLSCTLPLPDAPDQPELPLD